MLSPAEIRRRLEKLREDKPYQNAIARLPDGNITDLDLNNLKAVTIKGREKITYFGENKMPDHHNKTKKDSKAEILSKSAPRKVEPADQSDDLTAYVDAALP